MATHPDSGPRDLASLARGIRHCRKCPLAESRTHAVPGEGPEDARVILVGEAPGREEDREGRPFVGMAGTVLDEILEEAGWRREDLFITSSVKCRPPDNRTPRTRERSTCRDAWLDAQIRALQPELLVLLGRVAVQTVLGRGEPLGELRGEAMEAEGIPCLITFHPVGAMRRPGGRRKMIEDLQGAHGILEAKP